MSGAVLPGDTVRFRLSPEGVAALSGVFEESSLEANVAGADELGVWIDLGDQSAMLLKWQYLATAVVPVPPSGRAKPVARRIGFRFESAMEN
ncbi:MAG: hypothetical protein ACRD3N_06445 [Terracidiphilus sp.]